MKTERKKTEIKEIIRNCPPKSKQKRNKTKQNKTKKNEN